MGRDPFLQFLFRSRTEHLRVVDAGGRTDFLEQGLPVRVRLHLEKAEVLLVHPLRVLPVILKGRPRDVDHHVVRQHNGAVVIGDDALDRIFNIVQDEMLADGIPSISDLTGETVGDQGIRIVLQHFPASRQESRREEIKEIPVAEQQFDTVAFIPYLDVGRPGCAEQGGLLHLRNMFLQEFGLVETAGQVVAVQGERIDPFIVPVLMVDLPQVVDIAHQRNDEGQCHADAQDFDNRVQPVAVEESEIGSHRLKQLYSTVLILSSAL